MVRENGMLMMSETEYNNRIHMQEIEIKELKKRCEMLQLAVLKLTAQRDTNPGDIRVAKLDFLQMYDTALNDMFDHPERDVNDIYGHSITIHWHGVYCDCADGATPTNYIIPALQELCEEDPEECNIGG